MNTLHVSMSPHCANFHRPPVLKIIDMLHFSKLLLKAFTTSRVLFCNIPGDKLP